jgi:hypothetical protein
MDTQVLMERVEAAIAIQQKGKKNAARQLFAELWREIGPAGDPLCRCRLAHHMADLQDEPEEELTWDLRALEAAALLTDVRVKDQHPSLSVAAFYPSLLLNVAEDYRKLGELDKARDYVAQAQRSMEVLTNTEYGGMIRGGIARLAAQLESRGPVR